MVYCKQLVRKSEFLLFLRLCIWSLAAGQGMSLHGSTGWEVPGEMTALLEAQIAPGQDQVFAPMLQSPGTYGLALGRVTTSMGINGNGSFEAEVDIQSSPAFNNPENTMIWLPQFGAASPYWSRPFSGERLTSSSPWTYRPHFLGADAIALAPEQNFRLYPFWGVSELLLPPDANAGFAASSPALADVVRLHGSPEAPLLELWANSSAPGGAAWGSGTGAEFVSNGADMWSDVTSPWRYARASGAGSDRRLKIFGRPYRHDLKVSLSAGTAVPTLLPNGKQMSLADATSTTALNGLNLYTANATTSKLKGLPTGSTNPDEADQIILWAPSPTAGQPPRWEAFYRTVNNAAWAAKVIPGQSPTPVVRSGTIPTTLAATPGAGFFIRRGNSRADMDLVLEAVDNDRVDGTATAAIIDVDGDDMADLWEKSYAPDSPFIRAAGGGLEPGDDPDGDGQDNLTEYLFGTDPTSFNPPVAVAATINGSGSTATLTLSFPTKAGKRYKLQQKVEYLTSVTDTLPTSTAWTSVPATTTVILGTGAQHSVTLTNSTTASTYQPTSYRAVRFFRVVALPVIAGAAGGDTDSDGVSDLEEEGFDGFPGYGTSKTVANTDGDNLNDKQEILLDGRDPLDAFDRCTLTVTKGDWQFIAPGRYFRQRLEVTAMGKTAATTWAAVPNLPVTFSITSGAGSFSTTPGSPATKTYLTVNTSTTAPIGVAQAWLKAETINTPIRGLVTAYFNKWTTPASYTLRSTSFTAYPSPHLQLPSDGRVAAFSMDGPFVASSTGASTITQWQASDGGMTAASFNSTVTNMPTLSVNATSGRRSLNFDGADGLTLGTGLGADSSVFYTAHPGTTHTEIAAASVKSPTAQYGGLAYLRSTTSPTLSATVDDGVTGQRYLFASDRTNVPYTIPASAYSRITLNSGPMGFGLSVGTNSMQTFDLATATGASPAVTGWTPATSVPVDAAGLTTLADFVGSFELKAGTLSSLWADASAVPSVAGAGTEPYPTLAAYDQYNNPSGQGYAPLRHIGNVPALGSNGYLGQLFDVVLYNRVLAEEEKQQVYQVLTAPFASVTRTAPTATVASVLTAGSISQIDQDDGGTLPDWWERSMLGGLGHSQTEDTDGDGLSNMLELALLTHPALADTDMDGWSDGEEHLLRGTSPLNWDSDSDLLPDSVDAYPLRSFNGHADVAPANGSVDGLDYLINPSNSTFLTGIFTHSQNALHLLVERAQNNIVSDADGDNDGMIDLWEVNYGLNPADGADGTSAPLTLLTDLDQDGVSNLVEFQLGLYPHDADTDNDGMPDGWEVQHGLDGADPANANSTPLSLLTDPDGDGLSNLAEFQAGTLPLQPDTDSDGISDGYEVVNGLDPLNPDDAWNDKDGDRIPNLWEYDRGTLAGNAASLPEWDAVVDFALPEDQPAMKMFRYLQDAYQSLPETPSYRATILIKRRQGGAGLITTSVNTNQLPRKVAIIAEVGSDRLTGMEGVVLNPWEWHVNGEVHICGFVFGGGGGQNGVVVEPTPESITRFHAVNCLFRNFQSYRYPGGYDLQYGGALTNLGGQVSLEHCTFFRSNGYAGSYPDYTGTASLANVSGTLKLRNCIVWDDEYPSSTPVTDYCAGVSVESCLIQGGMAGSINVSPELHTNGYLTAASTACHTSGAPGLVFWDLHGQLRSSTHPSLGAEEWVNADGDGLPDWWELWWFVDTLHSDGSITNPYVYPYNKTLMEYFLDDYWYSSGYAPNHDADYDGLPDSWEEDYWGSRGLYDGDSDPDNDAFSNLQEYTWSLSPWLLPMDPTQNDDVDHDSLPDCWEIQCWGDLRISSGGGDSDYDGMSNRNEFLAGSNPRLHPGDGDGDGLVDADEVLLFQNLDQTGAGDADGDGLSNFTEIWITGTDPRLKDTNGDGRMDGFLNSWLADDSDGDGLTNSQEALLGTDPLVPDTDGDGVVDSLDAYALNAMMQSSPQSDPLDTTPPTLTLDEPLDAQLLP
ncbi:MAG: hypothetical protein CJBNEKGG_04067 [Prosthecobacter sp.]|nr:hypothetical protein [Prosthecobacter sp.]